MSLPVETIVAAGLVSLGCWWVVILRLKQIPRPEGYRGGILKRYRENFPKSPIGTLIRVCSLVFYSALAYWIWSVIRHKQELLSAADSAILLLNGCFEVEVQFIPPT